MKKNPVGRPRRSESVEPMETRARMLESAELLLAQKGYAGVSMDAIAKQIGITKATLYHYFPAGKDDLILAVAHQVLQRHQEGISQAIAHEVAPRDQLKAIARWMFSGNGQVDRILRDAGRFLPESHSTAIFRGFMESLYMPIQNVLKAGIAEGDFRPHDTAFMAWTVLTLLGGFEAHRQHMAPEELAYRLTEIIFNGIAPTEPKSAQQKGKSALQVTTKK